MKVVMLLSGGMDSAVLLWKLKSEGHDVRCLAIDYGQRHRTELYAAGRIATLARVPLLRFAMPSLRLLLRGGSQTDDAVAVPEGHYAAETMKATVVPNRNLIMLSIAAAHGISEGCEGIGYAAHTGDHAIYPDCRPEFVHAAQAAFRLGNWDAEGLLVLAPFLGSTKADIAKLGYRLGCPMGLTWSCYKGSHRHCGRCGTCVERREAFQLAGILDPTAEGYESDDMEGDFA